MGHPDAGRWVSSHYLRELALVWFSVGLFAGVVAVLSLNLWR